MDIDTQDTIIIIVAFALIMAATLLLLLVLSTIDVSAAPLYTATSHTPCSHAWINERPTCHQDSVWYLYETRRQGIHYCLTCKP